MHISTKLSHLKNNPHQVFFSLDLWLLAIWGFLLLGVVSRLFVYLDCQNLWLDEAFLAKSIYHTPWGQLLGKPLEWDQATPLGFLLITKGLGEMFGHGEMVLRFLPFCASVALLFVFWAITKELLSPKWQLVAIMIFVGSKTLVYYAAEFKQYEIEALCSAILLLAFIRGARFSTFLLLSAVVVLFSYGGVFLICGLGAGYIYRHRQNLPHFIKHNVLAALLFSVYFALLYFYYIAPQAVPGFKQWWGALAGFPPINPIELVRWLSAQFLPAIRDFALGGNIRALWLFVLLTLLGVLYIARIQRALVAGLVCFVAIYWLAGFMKLYGFAVPYNILGARLALFWQPLFVLCAACGIAWLYEKLAKSRLGGGANIYLFAAILLYIASISIKNNHQILTHFFPKGDMSALTLHTQNNIKPDDVLLMQHATQSVAEYYQYRHNFYPDHTYIATNAWAGSLLPLIQESKHNRIFAILQNNDWQYIQEIKDTYPHAIHLDSGFSLFIIDKHQ